MFVSYTRTQHNKLPQLGLNPRLVNLENRSPTIAPPTIFPPCLPETLEKNRAKLSEPETRLLWNWGTTETWWQHD